MKMKLAYLIVFLGLEDNIMEIESHGVDIHNNGPYQEEDIELLVILPNALPQAKQELQSSDFQAQNPLCL